MSSEQLKKKWEDPAYREMMSAAHRGNKPWNYGQMQMVIIECAGCQEVVVRQYKADRSNKYCSVACSTKSLHRPSIIKKSARSRVGLNKAANHWNWQGGISPTNWIIRQSAQYKQWRRAVLERDNHTCIWCGTTKNLNADHIKRFADFPALRFDIDNGRTLCEPCHRTTETYGNKKQTYVEAN